MDGVYCSEDAYGEAPLWLKFGVAWERVPGFGVSNKIDLVVFRVRTDKGDQRRCVYGLLGAWVDGIA